MNAGSITRHAGRDPPLAVAHLTALDAAPPAWFDLAAQAGYQKVGIRILPAVPGAVCYPLDRAALIVWRRRLADAGVGVHDVEFVPLTPDVDVEALRPTLALAAELGAQRLNVSGDDADTARLAGNFGRLCDLAAEVGLGVDLEFMRFRMVGSLAHALDIVMRAARPNGRLLIDLLHLFRSGGTPQMLGKVPPAALGSVQLCDAPRHDPGDAALADEARAGRLFPGEGALPLREYLDALPPGLPMSVEVPTGTSHPQLAATERLRRAATAARLLLSRQGGRPGVDLDITPP